MSGAERAAGLVVAYAVLVDETNACDALDEVVMATDSWKTAADTMRRLRYRSVPKRPAQRTVPADARDAAPAKPGVLLRKRMMSPEPWSSPNP
jgi:oligoribonuclease NrnB/cAMP/cGMP phosphodiesterase (DHH superfamily)